jgi:hypothetical protein
MPQFIEGYLDRWDNNGSNGPNIYDWAIAGIPFLSAASKEFPYLRESLDTNKQQFDIAPTVGENKLGNWWYRSQNSFDLGAGIKFSDTFLDELVSRRFADSGGVDAITVPGQVMLLDKTELLDDVSFSSDNYIETPEGFDDGTGMTNAIGNDRIKKIIPVVVNDSYLYAYYNDYALWFSQDYNYDPIIFDSKILSVDANGGDIYILCIDGVYRLLTNSYFTTNSQRELTKIMKLDFNDPTRTPSMDTNFIQSGVIKYIKERIIFAINSEDRIAIYQASPNVVDTEQTFTPTLIEWAKPVLNANGTTKIAQGVRYHFQKKFGWKKGDTISKVEGSRIQQYNFDAPATIISVSSDGLKMRVGSSAPPSNLGAKDKTKQANVFTGFPNKAIEIYNTGSFSNVSAIAEGPRGVYFTVSGPTYNTVLFSTIGVEEQNDVPRLMPPINVAELPKNERILTAESYLSTYLILGTTKGVRICLIDGNGSLIVGPLTVKSDTAVTALAITDNFCYASGAIVYPEKITNANTFSCIGLYKINLSKTSEDNSLFFAYQKDLYFEDYNPNMTTGDIKGIVINPIQTNVSINYINNNFNPNRIFVANDYYIAGSKINNNTGFIEKVDSGWIQTGRIRLDTAEDKIFQYLRITSSGGEGAGSVSDEEVITPASIEAYWLDELDNLSGANGKLDIVDIVGELTEHSLDTLGAPEGTQTGIINPHQYISYVFKLNRSTTEGLEAVTPVFTGYQLKANPANIKQTLMRLPLLALNKEKGMNGLLIQRPVFDRISVLETAEQLGKVVLFQDFGTGEERRVIIDKVQFVSNHIPESKTAADRGGILLATIRTVDINDNFTVDPIEFGNNLNITSDFDYEPEAPEEPEEEEDI